MCATVCAAQSNQVFLLGNDIGDSTAQRVRLALGEVDPPACIVIDPQRRAVWVGTSVSADDVLVSLLGDVSWSRLGRPSSRSWMGTFAGHGGEPHLFDGNRGRSLTLGERCAGSQARQD